MSRHESSDEPRRLESNPDEGLPGWAFFEDPEVFCRFSRFREAPDTPSKAIERPIVSRCLGELEGKRLLDLGCGDGWLGRRALAQGASAYVGLDGSRLMLAAAEQMLSEPGAQVHLQDLDRWCGTGLGQFDVVVSGLVLHYVERVRRVFEVVRHHLVQGGVFVFSIEHPVVTSSSDSVPGREVPEERRVTRYFREGPRADCWLGARVTKYHRTLETYFRELLECGFRIEGFHEGFPEPASFRDASNYDKRLDAPLCVVFHCLRQA